MRKHYSANFKAKVVQELFKEEKTLAQIAADYQVSTKQLSRWKTTALENLPRLFDTNAAEIQQEHEQQLEALYVEIGRLTTELSWLKKNLASTLRPRKIDPRDLAAMLDLTLRGLGQPAFLATDTELLLR
jgi:putative transposase